MSYSKTRAAEEDLRLTNHLTFYRKTQEFKTWKCFKINSPVILCGYLNVWTPGPWLLMRGSAALLPYKGSLKSFLSPLTLQAAEYPGGFQFNLNLIQDIQHCSLPIGLHLSELYSAFLFSSGTKQFYDNKGKWIKWLVILLYMEVNLSSIVRIYFTGHF